MSRHFVDSYECARGKLSLSEDTSTLETDVEDNAASRQRRKKSFPDFEDAEDEPVSSKKHKSQSVEKQTLSRMPIPPPLLEGIFDTSFQGNCVIIPSTQLATQAECSRHYARQIPSVCYAGDLWPHRWTDCNVFGSLEN